MVTITVYRTRLRDTKYKKNATFTHVNLKMKRRKEMVKICLSSLQTEHRSGILRKEIAKIVGLYEELKSYMKFSITETVKILGNISRILLRFSIRQLLRAFVNRSTLLYLYFN